MPPEDAPKTPAEAEQALERLLMKSPTRRDSYSDTTEEDEDDEEGQSYSPAGLEQLRQIREQNKAPWQLDHTVHSAYHGANQAPNEPENNKRCMMVLQNLFLSLTPRTSDVTIHMRDSYS